MKKHLLLLALVLPMLTGFSMSESPEISTCPNPQNVSVTAKSSGSISFDWDGVDAVAYEVYYVRKSDGYASPIYTAGNSDYVFSGLPAGGYEFFFRTDCGSTVSDWIGVEDEVIH